MNDFVATIIGIVISFLVGVFVMAWFSRGFLMPYLKAKKGGVLLRVHSNDGISARFFAAKQEPGGMLSYKDGKERRVISPVEGSVVRCARVYMMDAPLGDTAPFVWKKVVPIEEEGVRKMTLFEGYRDNAVVAQALEWALMKPKRKIPGLGLDLTTVLIILGGLAVVVYFLMNSAGAGTI
jgi:hypothetical protein